MDNFVYQNPVKILFGADTVALLGSEAAKLGSHALLVSGRRAVRQHGIHDKVVASLDSQGIRFTEIRDIQPNPLLSGVHHGISIAKEHGCDLIIGVGGGSVLDTAKAIGAGVAATHDVWKFFTGKKSVRATLPVVTVPTVAGSGSETNSAMVLTHDVKQLKFGFAHRLLYPAVCIADPAMTFSVAADQTAWGAVDALCHCIEPYFSSQADDIDLQLGFLELLCRSIIDCSDRLRQEPRSYKDRATMLWSSSLAMSPLAGAGLGRIGFPIHLLEHSLSATADIAHGTGLSALIPGWLRHNQDALGKRLARFGRQVFSVLESDEKLQAAAAVHLTTEFLRRNHCPVSLTDLGISGTDYRRLIDHSLQQAQIWRMKDCDEENLLTLLESCQR